ncbi:SDR family NAD(P)-dependent oxidoreductase [Nocardia sp. NBC_01388]|uniref:SDR family NAD(P)-dependent oxidoreductase n=1 Tax=Nocardia sp. NBC_01388 TaxID=2903596 RepID=UPI00324608C1
MVLVTGSSSGIGAAVARRFAAGGARIVINSATSADAGRQVAQSLPDAVYIQADISDADQANELVAKSVDHYGRLDVLVNNAGRTRAIPHRDIAAAYPDIWRDIFGLNVFGTWQTTVAAIPHLEATGRGAVVNISSIAGSRPAGSSIPYAVSKAAVEHMTRLLAASFGPTVRFNAVAPGLIETAWTTSDDFFASIAARVRETTPLRRVGQPDDVAAAVVLLAESEYTTGHVLSVDGGAHLL